MDLDLKEYRGLTEDSFNMDDLNFKTISGVSPLYKEVVFSFLADDADAVEEFIESAEEWTKKGVNIQLCQREDFDKFFDTIVRTKQTLNITNSAVAMSAMIDLVNQRLDDIERIENGEGSETTT